MVRVGSALLTDYKSSGRSWVKLWTHEWLDGTTRYEMSGSQRAFWLDLLAMAGTSRIPGYVCAGNDKQNLFGYPIARYEGILADGTVDVLSTFDLFERQGKIKVIITKVDEPKLYAIQVLSWDKYQSEYMRQRDSRKKVRTKTRQGAAQVTPKNTPRCGVEGEVEVEGEGDNTIPPASEFRMFWDKWPKKTGEARARQAWAPSGCQGHLGEILASVVDWTKANPELQFLPNAARWLSEGLWKERPIPRGGKHAKQERTRAASQRVLQKTGGPVG
jgi:hypothetical protein